MRRSTIVYLLLFAVVTGAYYYLKNKSEIPDNTADIAITLEPQDEVSYVFESEHGQPISIRVESPAGEIVELARNAENAWVVNLPIEAMANQGSAEAAASQILALRITDTLASSVRPEDVGLDQPEYIITVKFNDDVERKAEIGVITTSESGYYVRANDQLVIVGRSGIDVLTGLLSSPPYLETPTPSPIPPTATETPLPSPTPEPVTSTATSATPTP